MKKTVNRKARNNRIASILFCLAGLLWTVSGLISGNIGLNIPIGMMNICIGMMFLSMAKKEEKSATDPSQIKK